MINRPKTRFLGRIVYLSTICQHYSRNLALAPYFLIAYIRDNRIENALATTRAKQQSIGYNRYHKYSLVPGRVEAC